MSLDLQWPQYPQPLRLDRATLPAAPDFLLHRRGKRAGAALADLKSYEDAAPFFMTREWRHGVPRKTWEGYLAVAGRCRVPFALIVAELARGRIGILRDTPEGLIEGTGKGASWVYWRQSAFSWIDGFDVPNDLSVFPGLTTQRSTNRRKRFLSGQSQNSGAISINLSNWGTRRSWPSLVSWSAKGSRSGA